MKNYLLTGGFAAVLLLGACGSEEPTQEEADQAESEFNESSADSFEEQAEASEEQNEESSSDKGSRSNPYKIGDTAEVTISDYDDDYEAMEGEANVTIENVLRGEEAFAQLNEEVAPAKHDQPEEPGMEWFLFDLNVELVEYVDDDTSYTVATGITIFNEDGEQVPSSTAARQHSAGNTLFQGGTMESKEAYTAPSEGGFLIKINDAEEDVFFEVE